MPCSLAGRPPVRARRFCPGVMRQMANSGRAYHATVPDMDTRITIAIAAALLSGCGPLDIDITTTAAEGTDGDPVMPEPGTTTSLGASDTGAACGSTSASTSTTSGSTESTGDTSTTSEGSSSGEPPVCTVYTDDMGAWHCECGGVESDLEADCACAVDGGFCVCEPHGFFPAEVCGLECAPVMSDESWACVCDGALADPLLCNCHNDPAGWCSCPIGDPSHTPCVQPEP
jgi:hypothetical protein